MTDMSRLGIDFAGVHFKNPIIPASGTFGYGREFEEFYPLSELGGISVKGTTGQRRTGNLPPRIAETPSGMLNSVGLQNPGIDHFIAEELPYLKTKDTVVIANIAGSTAEEYAEIARKLDSTDVDMIEVNISCPNVTSIADIAKACEAEGADAVSLINTLLGMRIDIRTGRPILHNNVGGLSGPAVFPVAVRMVWQVANAVKIPVCGMGGVSSWEDAVEIMMAGASVVQVGAAIFNDPMVPVKINEGLADYCAEKNIMLRDIIGSVKPW